MKYRIIILLDLYLDGYTTDIFAETHVHRLILRISANWLKYLHQRPDNDKDSIAYFNINRDLNLDHINLLNYFKNADHFIADLSEVVGGVHRVSQFCQRSIWKDP